jgi:hypothetical protein
VLVKAFPANPVPGAFVHHGKTAARDALILASLQTSAVAGYTTRPFLKQKEIPILAAAVQ